MNIKKSWTFLLLLTATLSFQSHADNQSALFIVHFETGPSWQEGLAPYQQIGFDEHATNLRQLRKAGVIKFGARYEQYGMIFLLADSQDRAKTLLESDPGVKAGLFTYKIAKMNVFYSWQDSIELEE